MAFVRLGGDLAASRASGTGHGPLLRQKPDGAVKVYWPPRPPLLKSNRRPIIPTRKIAITIDASRHFGEVGNTLVEMPVELVKRWPIQIYRYLGKVSGRAGVRDDGACICNPVSTWGVSLCGISAALVAGVSGEHYRPLHGLNC